MSHWLLGQAVFVLANLISSKYVGFTQEELIADAKIRLYGAFDNPNMSNTLISAHNLLAYMEYEYEDTMDAYSDLSESILALAPSKNVEFIDHTSIPIKSFYQVIPTKNQQEFQKFRPIDLQLINKNNSR